MWQDNDIQANPYELLFYVLNKYDASCSYALCDSVVHFIIFFWKRKGDFKVIIRLLQTYNT